MKKFDVIRATRKKVLEMTTDLTVEDVNRIPAGMNNNIVWNIAHVIATQQNLFYVIPGLIAPTPFVESYKVGTKPEKYIDQTTYDQLRADLLSEVDRLEDDYAQNKFASIGNFTSKYMGITINTVEDRITFLAMHEGIHLGYILAMKRHI